jgi:hypothetical protein
MASAAVGGLMVLGFPAISSAQRAMGSSAQPVRRVVPVIQGSLQGIVRDERESPIAGAVVTALGATAIVAVTDHNGRFELPGLPAGSYVLTAHRNGYFAPPAQTIEISSGVRRVSALVLRHARPSAPLLAAGIGAVQPEPPAAASAPGSDADPPAGEETPETDADHGETAWRLRHARRSVLKDVTLPTELLDDDGPADTFWPRQALSRVVGSPARFATSFFADIPFSGQVNFLTTGSFETPKELFSSDSLAHGIAFVRLGAPVGANADWAIRGALTQADISSWILAGSYATRAPAQHKYDLGWSYSTQRYDGGNVLARRDVTDGSRNVGTMYGFDSFTINRALTVSYGSRYARYDFLEDRNLVSPRVEVTMTPAERTRISAVVSRTAQAPGAQEFLPPGDTGIWLPPQRTFSSIEPGRPLRAEQTTHLSVELERDVAGSTVSLRAFRQEVDDQLVTLFGADLPAQPYAKIGHYFVGNAGDVSAVGCTAALRTLVASRVQGSIAYSLTNAHLTTGDDLRYLVLLAPSVLHRNTERIHDVATSIETNVPETSTRVLVLYRVSNGFARPPANGQSPDRPGVGSRFDVQVRQSLPFLNFTSAKWEMLIAVRDFFSETAVDQSVYDELLVVRPPKRIVGGVTMHF